MDSHNHHDHHHSQSHHPANGDEQTKYDISMSGKEVPADADSSTFKVIGMDCADEIAAIQNSLKGFDVYKVEANLMSSTVQIWHSKSVKREQLIKFINSSGVKVQAGDKQGSVISAYRIFLVAGSGSLTGIAFVLQLLQAGSNILIGVISFISVVLGGSLILPKAIRALGKFRLDMNVLMVVAVIGAFYLGDFVEGATVVFLFALSEMLEAFSVVRARRAIRDVLNLSPKTAYVKQSDDSLLEIPIEQLKLSDILVVRAGDVFPTDGIVVKGNSEVNQAPLTGESAPVSKKVDDDVYGGTINLSGVVEIKVAKEYKDSKVSQIIKLVNEAQKSKAPTQKFVDKFASIYTPAVFVLAILIGLVPPLVFGGNWDEWIYKSLVLLVIACPCALVISTPVSIVSGLTAMARRGVLIKGGVFLETLGKLKALAVDKTGTITEGVPQVVSLELRSRSVDETALIKIAGSLEKLSSHPLGEAIIRFAESKNVALANVSQMQTVHGKGLFATLEGHEYFLGNHRFAHELGVCSTELESYLQRLEEQALSVVVVGHKPHDSCAGEVLGVFGVGDKVRENAKEAIQKIHKAGCRSVIMLSGDNKKTVEAIARQVGIDEVYGELLPDGKVEKIKDMVQRFETVGMVGDGINDAPALAQASLGIAMGAVGTDAAIETADVALMKDDLLQLANAIALGKRTLRIIRFNITFALVLKVVFLVMALLGYSSMWLAIAADTGATLLVVFNSLRLLKVE